MIANLSRVLPSLSWKCIATRTARVAVKLVALVVLGGFSFVDLPTISPRGHAAENAAAQAVGELIAAADLPEKLRTAMVATLAPSAGTAPSDTPNSPVRQWAGTAMLDQDGIGKKRPGNAVSGKQQAGTELASKELAGEWLYGMAARPLPEGQLRSRATPVLLSAAQAIAVQEMLTARAVLEAFAIQRLTDLAALRQALVRSSGELRVAGRVRSTVYQSETRGGFAVSFVAGRRDTLTAYLLDPPSIAIVRNAYRDVLTERTHELTRVKAWRDALTTVEHLEQLELATGPLLLDAARCHEALQANNMALTGLKRARKIEDARASVDWLVELGDIALRLGGDEAHGVAEEAFTEALRRFRDR
jgi:hypothetical protein